MTSTPAPVAPEALDALTRDELAVLLREWLLHGHLQDRVAVPLLYERGVAREEAEQVAIDEWMAASPIYSVRTQELLSFREPTVATILKNIQIDIGAPPQYMDFRVRVDDDEHGEFWLDHCGALMDVEPMGDEWVHGMCHTIEDPTFDATALATNPRARIRPIHRPPREPSDRHPHCHWTLIIDPDNEPVGSIELTDRVRALPLASVPNEIRAEPEPDGAASVRGPGIPARSEGDHEHGMADYRGPLDPSFHLADLSSAALVGAAREFQMQSHLLVAATDLALRGHLGDDVARDVIEQAWIGASWVLSERLVKALGTSSDADGLAWVLTLTPAIPPGFDRRVEVDGDHVHVTLTTTHPGLLDESHPGWCGVLARGDLRGVEAMARGVDPGARVERVDVSGDTASFDVLLGGEAGAEPDAVALVRIGMVATWSFDVSDPVRVN
ncbi:MAG TPA: hypothetical protein VFW74_06480 [Acidimicrobiia bacterium]|nr:hypothetical protein [Acidimicrobiia bacterium]